MEDQESTVKGWCAIVFGIAFGCIAAPYVIPAVKQVISTYKMMVWFGII